MGGTRIDKTRVGVFGVPDSFSGRIVRQAQDNDISLVDD
jgi:hypothetical protein